jgi:hypothetical protein
MNINHQLNTIKESFFLLFRKPANLIFQVLSDLIFILIIGVIGSYFIVYKMGTVLENYATSKAGSVATLPAKITPDSDISSLVAQQLGLFNILKEVLSIVIIAFCLFFIIFVISQGINWFLSAKTSNSKIGFFQFMKKFTKLNLTVFLTFVLLNITSSIITIAFLMRQLNSSSLADSQTIPKIIFTTTLLIPLIIITYFALVGYSLISNKIDSTIKQILIHSIKEWKKVIFSYIILIILFLIANYILKAASLIGFKTMIVTGIIIVLPLIAFSRTYLIKNLEK